MSLLLQFAQTLLVLTLGVACYVVALPRRGRFYPAALYWTALAPLSVVAGVEMFKLMAMSARPPFAMPVVAWTQAPVQALSVIGACGVIGLLGIIGLTAFVRGCLRGEKRPANAARMQP